MDGTQSWSPPGERTWTAAQPSILPSNEPFYAECWLCGKRHRLAPEVPRAVHVE